MLLLGIAPVMGGSLAQELPSMTPLVTLVQPTVLTGLPPITTATHTPSNTVRPSQTPSPSITRTASATRTVTPTQSPSVTASVTPSITASYTASYTRTYTASPTLSLSPSSSPTRTLSPTYTQTPSPSYTATVSLTPSTTATYTVSPSPTPTLTITETIEPSLTSSPTITLTPSQTATPSLTLTSTPTETRAPPVVQQNRPTTAEKSSSPSPILLGLGIVTTLLVGTYMVLYAMNAAAVDRYASGFLVQECPVCGYGQLEIEEKVVRVFGLPRVRRTVRCDYCRSVLREVGKRRWRYAVDRRVNEELYGLLNNRILHEEQLRELRQSEANRPHYIDEG